MGKEVDRERHGGGEKREKENAESFVSRFQGRISIEFS